MELVLWTELKSKLHLGKTHDTRNHMAQTQSNVPETGIESIQKVAQKVSDAAKLYAKHVEPANQSPAHFMAFLNMLGVKPTPQVPITAQGGGSGFPPNS